MNKAILILLALAAVQASATVVNTCDTRAADTTSATISDCVKGPCRLQKGSTPSVTLKFTPSSTISSLTADVKASLFGISVGFPGVDGSSVCSKIFRASDNSATRCPLSAGVEYIYKDSFHVSILYPSVSTTVTWALKSGSTTVKCFKVAVRIP